MSITPDTLTVAPETATPLSASPITGSTSQAEQWFSGSGAPGSGVGSDGDWYLDSVTGNFYEKTSSTVWTLRGNLKGPVGVAGPTGPQGAMTVYEQPSDPGAVALGAIWLDTDAPSPGVSSGYDVLIRKSADQSVTNNATPQADSELFFLVNVNEVWEFELALLYSGNDATGDFKYAFTFPTASGWWSHKAYGGTAAQSYDDFAMGKFSSVTTTPGSSVDVDPTDVARLMKIQGMIRLEAGGTFGYAFCNFSASAGRTSKTRAGSTLRARKLV